MFISGLVISGIVQSFSASPGARIDPEARPEVEGTGMIWESGDDKAPDGNNA